MAGAPTTLNPTPCSFINLPIVTDWNEIDADAVIFGVPYGKPYLPAQFPNDQSTAPHALRAASSRTVIDHDVIDADRKSHDRISDYKLFDGGDIPLLGGDVELHYNLAEQAWLSAPNFLPLWIFAILTIGAGWFLLHPGLGLGWALAKTAAPWKGRVLGLMAHTVFGLGMWVGALALG